jgi:hypothetical protein
LCWYIQDNDEVYNLKRGSVVYSEGPIDGQTTGDKCQQDLIHQEKLTSELDRAPFSCGWETTPEQSHHQDFLGQLATLLSDSIGPILATEEAVKERIQEMGANEQSWKCVSVLRKIILSNLILFFFFLFCSFLFSSLPLCLCLSLSVFLVFFFFFFSRQGFSR